jgi:glycosyltransferase involved in cell wall biosynthesis
LRVAHYLERWLELSAGFVAAQVNRSRHSPLVVSRDGWVNRDTFPVRHGVALNAVRDRAPERWKYAALRLQLQPTLALRRVDLIHVHFGYAAKDVLDVVRHRPYVLSLHGHDVTGLLTDQPGFYAGVPREVDAVIVPSRFLATYAAKAGFAEDLIRVLPSGVDTAFFTPTPLPDGPPSVAFVGRLVAKKGVDVLLQAWPHVHAAVPSAKLHILGEGPMEHLAESADETVVWHRPDPSRRHEQVRELIAQSSLVVTPSRTGPDGDSESLLLVNLEAGASGRPVVSTQHGGIPEFVKDGHSGLLVPEGDADALAAAIIRVLQDPSLAQRLATGGTEQAKRWDVNACAARMDDLYDELLARPRK